jgi:hypothetical protein
VRKWPKPLRWLAKGIASVAVVVGIPVLVVNIATTVYDVATLEGCALGLAQIEEDYKAAYEHVPPTGEAKVEAAYLAEIERTLESSVAALWCPMSVKDEQAAFVKANNFYSSLLDNIAEHGIPEVEQGARLLFLQFRAAGQRAWDAQQALHAAIIAEAEKQQQAVQ